MPFESKKQLIDVVLRCLKWSESLLREFKRNEIIRMRKENVLRGKLVAEC